MPVTAEPAVPPLAAFADARAEAFTVIELTVTSPPISESPEMLADALADDPEAVTLEETDAACATDPSAG